MKQSSKWISDYLSTNKNFIIPQQRIKELVNSFINVGVEDLSISRKDLSWGIGFPGDEHQTIYVWIDALFGYMSILGFMQKNDELYKKFWANEDCEIVHVMSKEIMRFHGIT
jgi:methionyl-tRNA synthetase